MKNSYEQTPSNFCYNLSFPEYNSAKINKAPAR